MRAIRTFILRLLADPAEPEALRGALQAVPEGETHPFADEQALLALLRQVPFAPEAAETPDEIEKED